MDLNECVFEPMIYLVLGDCQTHTDDDSVYCWLLMSQ